MSSLAAALALVAAWAVAGDGAPPAGTRYCFGDGALAPCPCGNESPPPHEEGCETSIGVGARLDAFGGTRLSADTLRLTATGMPEGALCVFVQGTQRAVPGVPFGDGLLCLRGALRRLGSVPTQFATATLPAAGSATLSARGAVAAPGTRTYQVWVRDPADFCTPAGYNLSGAVEVVWAP